jgi:ferredoxin
LTSGVTPGAASVEAGMRAIIDPLLCQGHAQCVFNLPELFALDDDDSRGYVLLDPVPDELADLARRMVGGCPERAISMIDSPAVDLDTLLEGAERAEEHR